MISGPNAELRCEFISKRKLWINRLMKNPETANLLTDGVPPQKLRELVDHLTSTKTTKNIATGGNTIDCRINPQEVGNFLKTLA